MMKKIFAASAAVSLLLILFSNPASSQESKSSTYTKIPTVKGIELLTPGTVAPEFTVRDLSDKEFRLKDCCGKQPVLLFFWSFFCGPCRDEMPLINMMAREYQGKGLHVIGVNLDGKEMKKAILKYAETEKIAFRTVFDELSGDSFTVADPYGVAGTPALFIVDRKGIIAYSTVGSVTADMLRKEIEKVMK
jgi:peroxiredoxin